MSLPAWAGAWKDNFEDGDFKGWTVGNYHGGDSVWKVESEKLIAERKDLWASSVVLDESIGWKDYDMEFEVMIEQALNPQYTFVIIGVRVSNNSTNTNSIGPALAYNWGAGNRAIVYGRGVKGDKEGDLVLFGEQPYPVQIKQWYRLKLSAIGNHFRLYIDDVLQREFSFDGYESGGVSMGAGGCIAHFDNVVISGPDIPNGGPGLSPVQSKSKLTTTWGRVRSGR